MTPKMWWWIRSIAPSHAQCTSTSRFSERLSVVLLHSTRGRQKHDSENEREARACVCRESTGQWGTLHTFTQLIMQPFSTTPAEGEPSSEGRKVTPLLSQPVLFCAELFTGIWNHLREASCEGLCQVVLCANTPRLITFWTIVFIETEA